MNNANIVQKNNTTALYEPLPAGDREWLSHYLMGLKHSQKMNTYREIALNPLTIKKAIAGMDVTPRVAAAIKSFRKKKTTTPHS